MDCLVKAVGRWQSGETLAFDYSGNQDERHPSEAADIPVREEGRRPARAGYSPLTLTLSNTRTAGRAPAGAP
jgi:hypothetical protein